MLVSSGLMTAVFRDDDLMPTTYTIASSCSDPRLSRATSGGSAASEGIGLLVHNVFSI